MKHLLALAAAATVALSFAPAAHAVTVPVGTTGNPTFTASMGAGGTYAGTFGITGIAAGNFSDSYTFTLPANGLGSGTVTTSANIIGSVNDVDFTKVTINGMMATLTSMAGGLNEVAFANGVPIVAGKLNTIVVEGLSRGNGAYGGQLSFTPTPGVPEPAAWAMMIVGLGTGGAAMRSRRTNVVTA